jgi:hypothetical protein
VIAEMITINPFDFFVDEYAYKFPFKYDAQLTKELAPYLELKEDGPLLKSGWRASTAPRARSSTSWSTSTNACRRTSATSSAWRPGIQTCEQTLKLRKGSCRDSAWVLVQVLRHLGLAARFVSGYLVQLTAGREGAGRPQRTGARLHRSARLDRGLHPRRRLDRPRPHLRPVRRRGPHPAGLHAGPGVGRAHHRRHRQVRGHLLLPQPGQAHPRGPARHQALHRRAMGRHRVPRPHRGRRTGRQRRAPDHGRRAHLRLHRRHGRRRVEHRRTRPDQEAARRRPAVPPQASVRPRRHAAHRSGQVVSRRAVAALGAGLLLAQGRRARLARRGSCSATSATTTTTAPRRRSASSARWRASSASGPNTPSRA